jgi:hypothetical protein
VVKILIFLDLVKISSFPDGHYLTPMARRKKSPDRNKSIRGFPIFILKILPLSPVHVDHGHLLRQVF